jgi:hypothetical protein
MSEQRMCDLTNDALLGEYVYAVSSPSKWDTETVTRRKQDMLTEILRRMDAAVPPPPEAPTYIFEVFEAGSGVFCASGESHDRREMEREAAHYAAQYAQDGPVEVKMYVRYPLGAA